MTCDAHCSLFLLLGIGHRKAQRWADIRVQGVGTVTATQATILMLLAEKDSALIGELADALMTVPSVMTGLIDRMCQTQLIVRKRDIANGRQIRISITESGRAAARLTTEQLDAFNERLREGFTDQEMIVVTKWLISLQQKFPRNLA